MSGFGVFIFLNIILLEGSDASESVIISPNLIGFDVFDPSFKIIPLAS